MPSIIFFFAPDGMATEYLFDATIVKAKHFTLTVKSPLSTWRGAEGEASEFFLRIHYVGDVAMAFMKGQLVQDEFYHGEPWTIGLKRYANDLKTDPLTFYFRPLRKNAPFLGDLPKKAVPNFEHGPVVDIQNVEVIPEYKFNIKL